MSVSYKSKSVFFFAFSFLISACAQAEMGTGHVQNAVTGVMEGPVHKDWTPGIELDSKTGNYIIIYKDGYGFFNSVVFEPATKITPSLSSRFRILDRENSIGYYYTLRNARVSKQGIKGFRVVVSDVAPGSPSKVGNWEGTAVTTSADSNFFLSWFCSNGEKTCSLPPGQRQGGLSVASKYLPGISVAEIWGHVTLLSGLSAEHDSSTPLGQQIEELTSAKNFVSRNIAVPRIAVSDPYDGAGVLDNLRAHIAKDIVDLKLIESSLAIEIDRWLKAAADAIRRSDEKAARANLHDAMRLLKKHHPRCDEDDQSDGDEESDDKKTKKLPIDRLAARVIAFNIKYVEKRLK